MPLSNGGMEDMGMYGSPMEVQTTIFDQVDNYLHMVNGEEDEKKAEIDFDVHKESIVPNDGLELEELQFDLHNDHMNSFVGVMNHGLHLDIHDDENVSSHDSSAPKDTPSLLARNSIQLTQEGSNSALTTPFLSGKVEDGNEPIHYNRTQLGKAGAKFSPLSSPALTSTQQQPWKPSSRRASNSSSRSKRIMVSGNSSVSSSSNKIVKNSPYMNASSRRLQKTISNGSGVKRDEWDEFMFSLPESSLGNDKDDDNELSEIEKKNSNESFKNSGLLDLSQNNGYPKVILPSNSLENKNENFIQLNTPYMQEPSAQVENNYTKSRSGTSTENNSVSPSYRSDTILMATESPVIRPSKSSTTLKHSRHSSSTKLFKLPNELNAGENDNSKPASVEPTRNTPISNKPKRSGSITKARSNSTSQEDSIQRKKEVHKNAEQERRNRLNNALSELNSLLPKEWKDSVAIPSKATTAQLACKYIRKLEAELEHYRNA
ncbi:Phosphate system positive regulatory protein PHO4 [Nakaseomyces bracarensis]|uniref:Phosphate system positive regulatory protein PHO4 n=1 Tax=Nakaseomyces bracarensis TaxID=273131 RepID=A0ABR4P0N0_9SACH